MDLILTQTPSIQEVNSNSTFKTCKVYGPTKVATKPKHISTRDQIYLALHSRSKNKYYLYPFLLFSYTSSVPLNLHDTQRSKKM